MKGNFKQRVKSYLYYFSSVLIDYSDLIRTAIRTRTGCKVKDTNSQIRTHESFRASYVKRFQIFLLKIATNGFGEYVINTR